MSELMLKGWKMLGENCPVTGTVPLMQHPKSGRKFSVALDMYIDELPAAGNGTAAPAALAPVTATPAPAPAPEPTPRSAPPPAAVRPASAPTPVGAVSSSAGMALDVVSEALGQQLQECAALLSQSHGGIASQDVIANIAACADALTAVERARRAVSAA